MADLATTQANAALQVILTPGVTYYLSLHSADPGTTGANEITGGSYSRQSIVLGTPANGFQSSTTAQTFTGMPNVTATNFGVCTTANTATYIAGGSLGGQWAVPAGATVTFGVAAITLSIS